jgi:release factor glutamine methyltransferase
MGEVTLSTLLRGVELRLKAAGIPSGRVEAEMIVGHVLGLKRSDLYLRPKSTIPPGEASAVYDLVKKRGGRVPLQYLLGECEFMSLPFKMRRGVFIPRPETEILVETVVAKTKADGVRTGRILDIGTGSGVIAISLAKCLMPDLVVATDISLEAVETAGENAILNRVDTVTRFVIGDRLDPVRRDHMVGFDVVTCNPPYIETGEIPELQPEVRDFEPRAALDGGPDGLRFIDGIVPGIPSVLNEGGLVALEVAETQGPHVRALLVEAGLVEVRIVKDLSGFDRIVIGRRS